MCVVPKGMVLDPFWSEIGYRFNYLGLKSGKVFPLSGTGVRNWVCFAADTSVLLLLRSEIGWGSSLILV